jgi:hypothetical protein
MSLKVWFDAEFSYMCPLYMFLPNADFLVRISSLFLLARAASVGCAEKIQLLVYVEEPASKSGGTMINKGHVMKKAHHS